MIGTIKAVHNNGSLNVDLNRGGSTIVDPARHSELEVINSETSSNGNKPNLGNIDPSAILY
jgi:hypothetical protein